MPQSVTTTTPGILLVASIEVVPQEILRKIVNGCGLLSRANLARTSKHLARSIVANKSLEFKAYHEIRCPGSLPDVDFLCADLDFMKFSHIVVECGEEFDKTGSSIIPVPIEEGCVVCTCCGWRDMSPMSAQKYHSEKFGDQHMAAEMSRLGVIYSPAVHILSRSLVQAIMNETHRIIDAQKPYLVRLGEKFANNIGACWDKIKVIQLPYLFEKQEKAGTGPSKQAQGIRSRWDS